MIRSILDSPVKLIFEENISTGEDFELSSELIDLFVSLFGEDLLEKCSHLPESFNGSAS
jgi:hypothetical protein